MCGSGQTYWAPVIGAESSELTVGPWMLETRELQHPGRQEAFNVQPLLKNQEMWEAAQHPGGVSIASKVRLGWAALFFSLTSPVLKPLSYCTRLTCWKTDSRVAAARCHMQEQLWAFLSRPLYMIYCTLGKKGALPSAREQMAGRGARAFVSRGGSRSSPVQACIWI